MATSIALNTPTRVTLDASSANVEAVTFAAGTRTVRMRFVAADGQVAVSGTDGAALGAAYMTFDADQTFELDGPNTRGGRTYRTSSFIWYFSHTNNAGVVELWAVE